MSDLVSRDTDEEGAVAQNSYKNSSTDNVQEAPIPDMAPIDGALDLTAYITEELPYPDERLARMKFFYKKRKNNYKQYSYTKTGDLVIYNKSGAQEELIPLKVYVPYDSTTQETRDQNRLDAIGQAETTYEEAFVALREATETYRVSGAVQPVLAAQKAVTEADQILTRVRYGARAVQAIPNPETREILFEKKYEVRKLIGIGNDPFEKEVFRLTTLEFPYHSFYGTYVDAPDAVAGADVDADVMPGASEATTRQRLKDGRYARIFYETEDGPNGFLSPFWPVEFTLGDTRYFTGIQAFEAARALEAGQPELRATILRTRSTRTMRFLTKKLTAQPKDPKTVWLGIVTAIYREHPELKERLLATGTDALVFADIRKGPSGIGMGPGEQGVLDPSRWLGENAFGLALETLRYKFREGSIAESGINNAPKERVISTEEQDAAKTAAIINAKRKFQFKPRRV